MPDGAVRRFKGTGSPEGVVAAPPTSVYEQSDAASTIWAKRTGNANTGWAISAAPALDTIAALKALSVPANGSSRNVLGYYAAGDGGDGTLRWDNTLTAYSFSATSGSATFTVSGGHPFLLGQKVKFYGSSLPSNVTAGTTYFISSPTSTTFAIATTFLNAIQDTTISPGLQIVAASSGSGSVNYADDGGTIFEANSNPQNGRWTRIDAFGAHWRAEWFGATTGRDRFTGTNRSAELQKAFEARSAKGGIVEQAAGFLFLVGNVYKPHNVVYRGQGKRATWIMHTGNNSCIYAAGSIHSLQGPNADYLEPGGVQEMTISATSDISSSQKGLSIKDGTQGFYRSVECAGYHLGTGFELDEAVPFAQSIGSEGNVFIDCKALDCLRSFAFVKSRTDGLGSFSDTRFFGCKATVSNSLTNAIGLYVANGCVLYSSTLDLKIQCSSTATGFTAIYLDGDGVASPPYSHAATLLANHYNIMFESALTSSTPFVRMAATDTLTGTGRLFSADSLVTYTVPTTAKFDRGTLLAGGGFVVEARNTMLLPSGTVSFLAGRLKWTTDMYMMPISNLASSGQYLYLSPPTSGVLDDASAEKANANGIALSVGEALWATFPRGADPGTVSPTYSVAYYANAASNAFLANENAYLIAHRDEGPGSVHLRNGLVVRPGESCTTDGIYQPSATQTLTAASAITTSGKSDIQISAASGITLTSAPQVADGVDGQSIRLVNVGSNSISLRDQGSVAGSNLRLTVATLTLAARNSVQLTYYSAIGDWVQTSALVGVI